MEISALPIGKQKPALTFPHFPTLWQAVLWRNWGIVPIERLAKALNCTPENLLEAGKQLGLEVDDSLCKLWLKRGYQTIIRQNWHLLTYQQLLIILEWTPEKLEYILREDDFLWHKMGNFKPEVIPPQYAALTATQAAQTSLLQQWQKGCIAKSVPAQEKPFAFLSQSLSNGKALPQPNSGLRMIYSYSALYGDPLMDSDADPYPEQLLADYAATGINAVWMQAVLYSLVPWFGESDYSKDCETRLENLRKLAQRMARHGLKLILYLNEPRGMPDEFFKMHPDWRGAKSPSDHLYALCTSNPAVLQQLSQGVETLFRKVPELGGLFCITMSENLTNCFSKTAADNVPPCSLCCKRTHAEVISEVIQTLERGAHRANPNAEVIAWSWGWSPEWDAEVIARLPKQVKLMMVSESYLETDCCGGVKGKVIDYSISKPGPGPAFIRLAALAKKAGIPVIAKVQLNNTWENSAVPYIPVPGLVQEHLDKLRALGVQDFMVSWTLGGYPGGNLRLLDLTKEQLINDKFGTAAAAEMLKAFSFFDKAFRLFPFNSTAQIYLAPQNYGPANLLFAQETGYTATMIGFPYDDLKSWCGGDFYPESCFEEAFARLAELWQIGLSILKNTASLITADKQANYLELMHVAEAASCHFLSTWLQIMFIRRRNTGDRGGMLTALKGEIEQAETLLALVRQDSRLGFEATNHYYYNENTLKEKIFNCRYLMGKL
ncbi:MAG: hypothetical protein WCT05_09970 [Lentisphaeria bacterium]